MTPFGSPGALKMPDDGLIAAYRGRLSKDVQDAILHTARSCGQSLYRGWHHARVDAEHDERGCGRSAPCSRYHRCPSGDLPARAWTATNEKARELGWVWRARGGNARSRVAQRVQHGAA